MYTRFSSDLDTVIDRLWPDGEPLKELTCPACGVVAGFELDEHPERCACGGSYDREQFEQEQADAVEFARNTAEALAEDAGYARHELRREREEDRCMVCKIFERSHEQRGQ